MIRRNFLPPTNPLRSWPRRIIYSTRSRPDVKISQLQRKIDILEEVVGLQDESRQKWWSEFFEIMQPIGLAEVPLRRFGSENDGGYVLPLNISTMVSGVVSIGVGDNNDIDFELASSGLKVHAWDHTVPSLPKSHPNIVFHPLGVGDPATDPLLTPLDNIIENSFAEASASLLILFDAEGAEWHALQSLSQRNMEKIAVMSVEFHNLGNMLIDPHPQLQTFQRLSEVFVPVVIHPNNYGAVWQIGNNKLPDVLEVVYINRNVISKPIRNSIVTQELNAPCCPDLNDLSWP